MGCWSATLIAWWLPCPSLMEKEQGHGKRIGTLHFSFFLFLTQNNIALTHVCTHSPIRIISFLNPSSSLSLSLSLSKPMCQCQYFCFFHGQYGEQGLPLEIMISPVEATIKTFYPKFVSHYQVLSRKNLNLKIRPQTNFLIINSNSLYIHKHTIRI